MVRDVQHVFIQDVLKLWKVRFNWQESSPQASNPFNSRSLCSRQSFYSLLYERFHMLKVMQVRLWKEMKTIKKNEDQRELRQPVRRAHEATFNFNCLLFYFRFQRCGESAIPLGLSLSRHLVKKMFSRLHEWCKTSFAVAAASFITIAFAIPPESCRSHQRCFCYYCIIKKHQKKIFGWSRSWWIFYAC